MSKKDLNHINTLTPIDENKQPIIKCPHCGYEYLPGEIYIPGEIIGNPEQILKDPLGKIIYFDFKEDGKPNLKETYICDGCGKAFTVEASTVYKTKEEVEELDFTQEYVSLVD